MDKYIYAFFVILLIVVGFWSKKKIESRNEAVGHVAAIVNIGNKEAPKSVSEFVKLLEVRRERLDVIYEYEITGKKFPTDSKEYYLMLHRNFSRIMCDTPKIRSVVLGEGVRLIHRYFDTLGKEIKVFVFSEEDCSKGE